MHYVLWILYWKNMHQQQTYPHPNTLHTTQHTTSMTMYVFCIFILSYFAPPIISNQEWIGYVLIILIYPQEIPYNINLNVHQSVLVFSIYNQFMKHPYTVAFVYYIFSVKVLRHLHSTTIFRRILCSKRRMLMMRWLMIQ